MRKTSIEADSLREGLNAKGRLRREAAAKQAIANGVAPNARNDLLPALKVEALPVESLRSHSRRLRKNDAAHVREVANSIRAFGFNVPLIVGRDSIVIDGETRLEAAKLLGLAAAPCIRVDHLTESEQRLLRLAVNRLGEKGSWDIAELEAEFKELIILDAPIELSGFGADEIDQLVIGEVDAATEAANSSLAPGRRLWRRSETSFGLVLIA
jgi:hypothetical protein